MKTGKGKFYHENGTLWFDGNFENDKFHQDNMETFHPTGNKKFEGTMKEGQKQGELSNHNSSRLKVKFSNLSLISYKKVFQSVFMKM